jgi:hypothetical protein
MVLATGVPSRPARDRMGVPDSLAAADAIDGVARESAVAGTSAEPSEAQALAVVRDDSLDVARSPYAGAPLDRASGVGTGPAMQVADAEPGAADTHWP